MSAASGWTFGQTKIFVGSFFWVFGACDNKSECQLFQLSHELDSTLQTRDFFVNGLPHGFLVNQTVLWCVSARAKFMRMKIKWRTVSSDVCEPVTARQGRCFVLFAWTSMTAQTSSKHKIKNKTTDQSGRILSTTATLHMPPPDQLERMFNMRCNSRSLTATLDCVIVKNENHSLNSVNAVGEGIINLLMTSWFNTQQKKETLAWEKFEKSGEHLRTNEMAKHVHPCIFHCCS